MKKLTAVVLTLFFVAALAPRTSEGATFPPYENTVREWGTVIQFYQAPNFFAFVIHRADGGEVRLDCGSNAVALACDQLQIGDSALISGHLEDLLFCGFDGVANKVVPNVIYRCNGGTCVQLTP